MVCLVTVCSKKGWQLVPYFVTACTKVPSIVTFFCGLGNGLKVLELHGDGCVARVCNGDGVRVVV